MNELVLHSHRSGEEIISLIDYCTPGSRLPHDILVDASPYKYPPSSLQEGIWYLVCEEEKKESAYGFWRAKGEACKIYMNSDVNGWRQDLEYFEGEVPYGRKTDWVMQEYWLSQKGSCHKHKPNVPKTNLPNSALANHLHSFESCDDIVQDSRSLCRVFLCRGNSSYKIDRDLKNSKSIMESGKINSMASVDTELDWFLSGDYLELDDLQDIELNSQTSENSSCCT